MSLEFISTPILHQRYSFLTSSFCHFNIWAWRVCAAQQGMLFASLSLKRGIEITLFLWKRVYFTLDLTLEQGRLFPEFWLITNHKRYKRRNWLSSGQLSGIGYLFSKFLSGIGFQIHLFFFSDSCDVAFGFLQGYFNGSLLRTYWVKNLSCET